jgi:hypothetical protein
VRRVRKQNKAAQRKVRRGRVKEDEDGEEHEGGEEDEVVRKHHEDGEEDEGSEESHGEMDESAVNVIMS